MADEEPLSRIDDRKDGEMLSLTQEELEVGTRWVERARVRIKKTVREHEQLIEQDLLHDEVDVRRVRVDRVIDEPVGERYEEDVLVIPVMEEVVVVRRQLVLREELHIRRRSVQTAHREPVVLRTEELSIERETADHRSPEGNSGGH